MDRLGTSREFAERARGQAHLIGLEGRGMAALAEILARRGDVVTGTSRGPFSASDRLRRLGVRVHQGHPASPLPRSARLLVHEPDLPREHPDRLRAARSGIEQATRRDLIGRLLGSGIGVAAVGGRRAGAAAAMVGWTLAQTGLDPTLLLATPSPQLGDGGRLGLGPHVVVEADEGPTADLPPAEILLLLDDGPVADRSGSIGRWAESAPRTGYALQMAGESDPIGGPEDVPGVQVERFSLARGHDWWGADLREERGCFRFRAFHRGRFAAEVRLRIPGRGHVLGALAAVAVCARLGVMTGAIKEALGEFAGVSRGFESRGSFRGVTLVDDEAPGPTGAGEAIGVARQVFGRRTIRVAFRPEAARPAPPASSFAAADSVLIIDESGTPGGPIARGLAEELEASGSAVTRARDLDEAIRWLDRHLEPGDVLVTLGAGDVGTIADAFLRRLPGDRHA